MKTKPLHIFKPAKNFDYYLCVFGGIVALAGAYFLLSNNFKKEYPQLFEVLGGLGLVLFGLFCLFYYFNRSVIYEFEDSFELVSGLFSRRVVIRKAEIQSWAELSKTSKHRNWQELYIFTAEKKYRFYSYNYSHYFILRSKLSKKPRNLDFEKNSDSKSVLYFSLFFLIFGSGFLLWGLYYFVNIEAPVLSAQAVKINQVVTSEIKSKKHGRSSRYFELKLKDYPEFSFNIKGDSYDAMFTDEFEAEVRTSDTLTIGIPQDAFGKKISKTKPLTFWDKTVNYYNIQVVSVSHGKTDYLVQTDATKEKKSSRKSNAWGLGGFGLVLFAIGLFIFIKRKKIAAV